MDQDKILEETNQSPLKKIKESKSFNDLNKIIIENNIDTNKYNITNNECKDNISTKKSNFFAIKKFLENKKKFLHLNNSDKFVDNKCYCCKNYLIIHELLQYKFIEKYKISSLDNKENNAQKLPSKYIKILFRLKPKLFIGLKFNNYKYLDSLKFNYYINNYNLSFLFETYFYQPDISYDDYIICTICLKDFCPIHTVLNEFFMKKCNCCSKYWNICAWCKNDYLFEQFDFDDKIINEDILCCCFHEPITKI